MDPSALALLATALVALGLGFALGRLAWTGRVGRQIEAAGREADALLEQAQQEAEAFRQQHVVTAREALEAERRALKKAAEEQQARHRRLRHKLDARQEKLSRRLKRLRQREDAVQKALDAVDALRAEAELRRAEAEELRASIQKLAKAVGSRQQEVAARERDAEALQEQLAAKHVRLDRLVGEHIRKLESVTGISKHEALERLVEELENEAKLEAAAAIKEIRDEARMTANREARKVVLTAIQRTAASHTIEHTVSAVPLTSEDMKGRVKAKLRGDRIDTYGPILNSNEPVLVTGKLSFPISDTPSDEVEPTLLVDEAVPLADAVRSSTRSIRVKLSAERHGGSQFERLRQLLLENAGGCPVELLLDLPDGAVAHLAVDELRVEPSEQVLSGLERLFGGCVAELR